MLSLLPMIALGLILGSVLQSQVVDRTLVGRDALGAHHRPTSGFSRSSTRSNLAHGLSARRDRLRSTTQLSAPAVGQDLARIKVWNARDTVVYSEDHSLLGRRLKPSDDLEAALAGHPMGAQLVDPSKDSETASEVGLGQLIEVYVPLRFRAGGPTAGAFEIYLSYSPVAAAVSPRQADDRAAAGDRAGAAMGDPLPDRGESLTQAATSGVPRTTGSPGTTC